jgi:hypothetical protein
LAPFATIFPHLPAFLKAKERGTIFTLYKAKVPVMNDQRGREDRVEQSMKKRDNRQQIRQSDPPTGFEGMNFEQRRGCYRGNTFNSSSDQTGDENSSGMRQEDL